MARAATISKKRSRDPSDENSNISSPVKRQKQSTCQVSGNLDTQAAAIDHWRRAGEWPKALFEIDPRTQMLAKKRSSSSGRKRSIDGSTIAPSTSDEKTREEKSAPYKDNMYEEQLQLKGFYMKVDPVGPNNKSMATIKTLLKKKPALPKNTLFADHLFVRTLENIRNRNETRVIRDIAELIVPSAESMSSRGEIDNTNLIESVNEGWNMTEPITPTRPQPDFSIGFKREAFKETQLSKIRPILGDSRTQVSRFRGTWYMYFPFLSSEIKCGAAALDVADRQNAHSMSIAVRAIVHLFQLVNRQREIDREILAFSVSHDDQAVRIYGYYPVIEKEVTYHRQRIHTFTLDGKDKWTSYRFVKSIYQIWAPKHLTRILKILDELPEEEDISLAKPTSQGTGLSQQVDDSSISEDVEPSELHTHSLAQLDTRHTPETSVSLSRETRNSASTPTRRASKRKLQKR